MQKKSGTDVAFRYAKALWELAKEDNLESSLLDLIQVLRELPLDVYEVIQNPMYADEIKESLLNTLCTSYEMHHYFKSYLFILFQNKRFHLLPLILEALSTLIDEAQNICRVELWCARPADSSLVEELESFLGSHLHKKVFMATRHDESLKAGYVLKMGHTLVDASLKTQLKQLEQCLIRGE